MPGLALREFECSLCQAQFTMLAGDLLLPGPNVCDDCLTAVWRLDDETLSHHVRQHLGTRSQEEAWVNRIVQHIKWHRAQWATVTEPITNPTAKKTAVSQSKFT